MIAIISTAIYYYGEMRRNRILPNISKLLLNSFMIEVPIMKNPVHITALQINGLVSIW